MTVETTKRGFDVFEFYDDYNEPCSIQKSSLACRDAIWLGVNNVSPKILAQKASNDPNATGWLDYPLPDGVFVSSRMHLTQDMVKKLLPMLNKFVETGEIS